MKWHAKQRTNHIKAQTYIIYFDIGPVYTTMLLGENEDISLCFSLPCTPKWCKRQEKRRLLKTETEVESLKKETSKTSVFLVQISKNENDRQ